MTTQNKTTPKATETKDTGTQATPENNAPENNAPEKVMTPFDMCVKMFEQKMSEDDMIDALVKHAGLGTIKAVNAYKNFMKKAGHTESKEEVNKRVNEVIEDFVIVGEDAQGTEGTEGFVPATETSIDLKKAIDAVIDELDVGQQAARGRVKAYCKVNSITLPEIERGIPATPEQTAFIIASRKAGDVKKDTVAAIVKKWADVSENRAKNMYTKACKDAGLVSDIAKYSMDDIATWAKGADVVKLTESKDLTDAFSKSFPDYSEHYAKKMIHMIVFARIYCAK